MLDGAEERDRRDHNDRAWLAYETAVLTRIERMPPLKTLLMQKSAAASSPQSVDERIEIAHRWTAAVNAAPRK